MNLTPEVREVLLATLTVAEHNLQVARDEFDLRVAQANAAQVVYEAAQQTVDALNATLDVEPAVEDKFKTFGEG